MKRHKAITVDASQKQDNVPSLATALIDLRAKTIGIRDDLERVLGILDGIHTAKNVYDLIHRLKSLIGRERSMTRMVRQWCALLEPLEQIAINLGETDG